jgi:hypothetical protein
MGFICDFIDKIKIIKHTVASIFFFFQYMACFLIVQQQQAEAKGPREHLPSYPRKKTAKLSNSNSKSSEEIQTALHRPPLLQRTRVPSCTSSSVSASVSRCLSVSNLLQCHIKWFTVS